MSVDPSAAGATATATAASAAAESDDERFARAEDVLGVRFRNRETLRLALTHRSVVSDSAREVGASNERLEFLGDALLGFLVAAALYERFPDAPEGDLTDWRVALVRADTLARWARQLDLGSFLYLAMGKHRTEELSDRVLGNAFEAVLAAIYLDAGLDAAREFLDKRLEQADEIIARVGMENYKGRLQELAQDPTQRPAALEPILGSRTPVYVTVAQGRQATEDAFTVEVRVEGRTIGAGKGSTKRLAEQAAARDALTRLNAESGPGTRLRVENAE